MTILVGDCLDILPTLPADSFDAIVTDPPYHLTTGKKGGTGQASLNPNSPAGRAQIGTGFMGKAWDGGDIAFRPETWTAVLRVAKPGAYLAAFGGTRTFHRLMVAIEDAGWEIRDTLMWVYGSGFPKSHNGGWGGTALKPAWEPIILARKPLTGTVEANWRKYGTGALNIDGCRVEAEPRTISNYPSSGAQGCMSHAHGGGDGHSGRECVTRTETAGRWPANVLHDGSDEVVALFPREAGAQAPVFKRNADTFRGTYGVFAGSEDEAGSTFQGDSGSAARFFYCSKASREDRNHGLDDPGPQFTMGARPCDYVAVNRAAKGNHHPTVKPHDLMRWLCRLVTPPAGHVLDPFTGSGSTGRAALAEGFTFTGIELDPDYAAIANKRIHATQPGLALSTPPESHHVEA